MKSLRTDNFAERRKTAEDAKKALLEKLKAGSKSQAKGAAKSDPDKKA